MNSGEKIWVSPRGQALNLGESGPTSVDTELLLEATLQHAVVEEQWAKSNNK